MGPSALVLGIFLQRQNPDSEFNAHGGPFHERIVAKVNTSLDYTTAMIAFKHGWIR
jgi:hypothetical protein